MRFIDLFAGLGGFHLALQKLGHECVFASEIDPELITLYEKNYGITPKGDINDIKVPFIPRHDILCAGFPCQPFSKAGKQKGFASDDSGKLFWQIIRIVRYHKPEYILLENVSNLEKHKGGQTWKRMFDALRELKYDVKFTHLSPEQFGIPQIRRRMFIVARRGENSLASYQFPSPSKEPVFIHSILDHDASAVEPIPDNFVQTLEAWQDFIARYPADMPLPTFPIWAMEFGADYPYENTTPFALGPEQLGQYRGMFGVPLKQFPAEERYQHMPHYALTKQLSFPKWKINFIQKNRNLYERHRDWINEWLPNIQAFSHSHQKLEWNCKGATRNIWEKIIRFRPSGVRIKLPTTAPSLNTIDTQTPIIGWERRFMTMREGARLHGMGDINIPERKSLAVMALGNAVNVEIVYQIAAGVFQPSAIQEDNSSRTHSLSAD